MNRQRPHRGVFFCCFVLLLLPCCSGVGGRWRKFRRWTAAGVFSSPGYRCNRCNGSLMRMFCGWHMCRRPIVCRQSVDDITKISAALEASVARSDHEGDAHSLLYLLWDPDCSNYAQAGRYMCKDEQRWRMPQTQSLIMMVVSNSQPWNRCNHRGSVDIGCWGR